MCLHDADLSATVGTEFGSLLLAREQSLEMHYPNTLESELVPFL